MHGLMTGICSKKSSLDNFIIAQTSLINNHRNLASGVDNNLSGML
jgi:hypothetical protein